MQTVWVFTGPRAQFPSGIFSEREKAEQWIRQHRLNGTLTAYPMDVGVYDWAVSAGLFTAHRDDQRSSDFIQRFSSASQEHYHYENGNAAYLSVCSIGYTVGAKKGTNQPSIVLDIG